ncbi:SDR family NAD(P)-dependent oxidoreductase [Streptomyces sp. G5(2025)]|uniref:SDR family NAD(P)-dependent oxidoreductase n=1 Tax=Streptomyces sp. G5(2025) TaxID=3406628 RepID=UPI003C209623
MYRGLRLPTDGDQVATAVAQPRIVAGSVAGLRVLARLGVTATGAVGHSLGELSALHWAGAMDEDTLLRAVAARGRLMDTAGAGGGGMAGISASAGDVQTLIGGEPVVVAGFNSPTQTVISGPAAAVEAVMARARARGIAATRVPVSHAFHSDAVAPAAQAFRAYLADRTFTPPARTVVSTVTGAPLPPDVDVPELLTRQVLDPVRFSEAVQTLATDADLFVEVGPGQILRNLAAQIAPSVPAVSLTTDGPSLAGLFRALGAAYVMGAPIRHEELFRDRYVKPLPLDKQFSFLAGPCEAAPDLNLAVDVEDRRPSGAPSAETEQPPPGAESLAVLRRLAAERAELPLEAVRADSNPIDELHLSSITVGQIVTQAARELGVSTVLATSAYATSTLTELAAMLDELADTALGDDGQREQVAGVAPWVRSFTVDLTPAQPVPPVVFRTSPAEWEVFATRSHPLAVPLQAALSTAGLGDGVLLCLPREADEDHLPLLISAVRAALSRARQAPVRLVAVGGQRGAAGIAKTLHLEAPNVTTTVIVLPDPEAPSARRVSRTVACVEADAAATEGFAEVWYDVDGRRSVPVLRALPPSREPSPAPVLSEQDVLLVTGGGKGITAEAALALVEHTGAGLALLGRSAPDADRELAANLERLRAAGIRFRYLQADVTAADEVKAAVQEVHRWLGPVTAVLHGAGRNEPRALVNLDEDTFRRTLAPKVDGLKTLLTAVQDAPLRLLVTFGSIIGRAGLRGQGDYATANDWLTDLTRRYGEQNPRCRCIAMEWSVWSGSGMGERLGVLESLMREGISPIPVAEGVATLKELLAAPRTPDTVVVMGRAGGLPTLALETGELPLGRFLERPRIHYPRIELVADADLSAATDGYLADHMLDGDLLFPAVLGMEAMAQAAAALTGRTRTPVFTDVEFLRPIVVPADGSTTLRVAVLADGSGTVRAALRSSDTGFQTDHFRATLCYESAAPADASRPTGEAAHPTIPLKPAEELYGSVLFQGGRFQRLLGYQKLSADGCVARISSSPRADWFGGFHPAELTLADPGTRDALMHSIQCCVPDATLLPVSVQRLWPADPARLGSSAEVTTHATEVWREGDTYLYDVDVRDADGALVERWEGLKLQAVRKRGGAGPWPPALLAAYLQRNAEPYLGARLGTAVVPADPSTPPSRDTRRAATRQAVSWAVGRDTEVGYRPDGKPLVPGLEVSSAHGAGVTFAVAATGPVACDVEAVGVRTEREWTDLLGADGASLARLIAAERGEGLNIAATRVWGAIECLRKAGHAQATLMSEASPGGASGPWTALRGGFIRIASFVTTLAGIEEPVVFTMAMDEGGVGE